MRWPFPVVVLCSLASCQPTPLDLTPPPAPSLRTAVACDDLARANPTARWEDTGTWSPGPLVLADPSTIGGPFAPPLRLEASEAPGARVLVAVATPTGQAGRVLCVQLRLGPGEVAAWRDGPAVVIDTDLLLIGHETPVRQALRPAEAPLVPCLEGPADELQRATAALASRGLVLSPVLPTLTCLEGARPPFDLQPLRAALHEQKAEGRAFVEARPPAWPLLAALGDRPWTRFAPTAGAPPIALLVEVRSGDGAYPVRLGRDDRDQVVVAELSLP